MTSCPAHEAFGLLALAPNPQQDRPSYSVDHLLANITASASISTVHMHQLL